MSIYQVNKVCWHANNDPVFREQLQTNPERTLASLNLTDPERQAILTGDVATLHQLGAHDYLLGHLQRWGLFGLNRENYQARMKALLTKGEPLPRP
jgi:hypothetical protein